MGIEAVMRTTDDCLMNCDNEMLMSLVVLVNYELICLRAMLCLHLIRNASLSKH